MLLLGHRGAAGAAYPENTVAAVERAFALGADGVEVDVRLTSDGGLVCVHDESLWRVAGIPYDVSSLTAAEVAAVRLPGGHGVPALADVVAAARGRGRLVVEVKTGRGWPDARRVAAADAVAAGLARLGVTRRSGVVVSSFDRLALAAVRGRGCGGVRTAVLADASVGAATVVRWALDGGHDEAHPHVSSLLAAPAVARQAHAVGVAVTAWTADRPDDLRRLAAYGVDAAICDDPAMARAALAPAMTGDVR